MKILYVEDKDSVMSRIKDQDGDEFYTLPKSCQGVLSRLSIIPLSGFIIKNDYYNDDSRFELDYKGIKVLSIYSFMGKDIFLV